MNKFEFSFSSFRWIDITAPKKNDLEHLASELNIPNRILINALDPEHLPKYEFLESASVIYLRTIDKNKTKAFNIQDLTTKITIIFTSNAVITIHRLDHFFLKEIREECANKQYSYKDLIKKIISQSLLKFDDPITELESRIELFEESIFENNKNQNIIKEGYFLKRKASAIRKILKFSLDILVGLRERSDFSRSDFVGLKENIERNLFYTEDAIENVTGLLNLHISLAAQKTNEVMRVLTVFSIFFLPLNFLTGIYGMNFEHIPELKMQWGYYYLLSLMTIISTVIFFWFYRKGWLKKPT